MAKINYDPFEGYERLATAAQQLDERAMLVLTLHAALEAEMDLVLSKLLPRPERIRGIGFANKVKVLDAAWVGEAEAADKICRALKQFNDVRNAVAHNDRVMLQGCLQALTRAYQAIDPSATEEVSLVEIAQGVCGYLGDGPTPAQLVQLAEGLSGFISKWADLFPAEPRPKPPSPPGDADSSDFA